MSLYKDKVVQEMQEILVLLVTLDLVEQELVAVEEEDQVVLTQLDQEMRLELNQEIPEEMFLVEVMVAVVVLHGVKIMVPLVLVGIREMQEMREQYPREIQEVQEQQETLENLLPH
jgi:hypothetical protein